MATQPKDGEYPGLKDNAEGAPATYEMGEGSEPDPEQTEAADDPLAHHRTRRRPGHQPEPHPLPAPKPEHDRPEHDPDRNAEPKRREGR